MPDLLKFDCFASSRCEGYHCVMLEFFAISTKMTDLTHDGQMSHVSILSYVKIFEFFTIRNFWQNLPDLPNENKSGEI